MYSLAKGRSKFIVVGILVLGLTSVVSSASVQHHPFSELFPPDESLGFGGNDIENVSRVELSDIVPDGSDIIFRDAGDNPTLRWDESAGEWRLNGVNLNAGGNSVTDIDSIDGGDDAINVNDILDMSSNSINGLNNLEFDGGVAYITQNSDGENILLQADDSSANRNNYIRVDPDNQVTSFPTGDVQIPNGDLDMGSNSITNFFGSPCPTGEVVADVGDDGTLNCVSVSDVVSSDYVARVGDSMTGNLDMTGNDILDIGNLGGSSIVNTGNIAGGAVTSNELDETDSYSLGWNNLGITQNDISVSNLGAADATLDMNNNNIANFFGSPCSSGAVMTDVNSDGSYDCTTLDDEVQDTYVNRNGDSMTGNLDLGDNQIANLDLQNVNNLEMDGDIQGGGTDFSINEVGSILGPNNGDTDLNIQTQGAGGHVVSIEDGSSSNADIARFEEGTQNVVIPNGNLDLSGNSLNNFFGSACGTGEVVAHVNDDGSLDCVDATGEVENDFVSRSGDSMTGQLDMTGNNILNIGNLGGSNIVNTDNIAGGAVTSNELDETDSYSLGWNNLGITQNDISVSNLGAADSNLNMNSRSITNFFGSACSAGNVVAHVNDDGSLDCVNAADEVQDTYVNRNGDSMTGDLDLGDNRLRFSDTSITENANNDLILQGRDPQQKLELTDGGSLVYREYSSSANNIFEVDSTGSGNGAVRIGEEGTTVLDMNGNNINNFFGSQCSSGEVAVDVNDDGSIDCVDATGEVQNDFVNRNGDTMTGDLEMQGNNIVSPGLVDGVDIGSSGNALTVDSSNRFAVAANSIGVNELDEGNVDDRYLQLSGDVMSGSLDMNGNSLNNFFGSACSNGQVMVDVNSDGSYDCTSLDNEVQDTYVNRNGDSMTGDLDMQDNNLDGVNTVNSGGSTVNTGGDIVGGGTIEASADLRAGSGVVSSSSEMCIGNQC